MRAGKLVAALVAVTLMFGLSAIGCLVEGVDARDITVIQSPGSGRLGGGGAGQSSTSNAETMMSVIAAKALRDLGLDMSVGGRGGQ